MERGRVIALGTAYVEARINSSEIQLPEQRRQLPAFLDAHSEADLSAGGSIPNIISSFVVLSNSSNVRLFSCVGKDKRGNFFAENIDKRLGKPKTSRKKPTGVWVGIYDNGLRDSFDFYGAADNAKVSRRELKKVKNEVFITDIDFMSTSHTFKQVQKALKRIRKDNGVFALSLGHAGYNPNPSDQENIQNLLSFLCQEPDLIFGNEHELLYITGKKTPSEAIETVFPESRLLVITREEKGAIIRYDGKIISVPTLPIDENLIDSIGAGDTFMGTALAILNRTPYTRWNEDGIVHAMRVANYAASLVIQSMNSHLTYEMGKKVLDYEEANDYK